MVEEGGEGLVWLLSASAHSVSRPVLSAVGLNSIRSAGGHVILFWNVWGSY